MELQITYSKEIQSLVSRLRHPSIMQVLRSRAILHPTKSDCIYIEMSDNADAQITAYSFDGDEVIYSVDLYVDDVYGETKQVLSWTTTDWKEVRSKIVELKGLV